MLEMSEMKKRGQAMEQTKNEMITVTHLCKQFGNKETQQTIIDDLEVCIYKGDFTIIMGSSGAGKSTLMYMLSGMDRPTSGQILWNKTEISLCSDDELAKFRKYHCGFVFQQIYLLEHMSLMDNVLTAGLLSQSNKKAVIAHAKQRFEQVKLSKITQEKLPSQVSGGEAQRAGIVRAIIHHPDVVFADEPTGALNSTTSDAILNVFSQLHADGQTIIMVTHDQKTALRASRILYLKDGKIYGECMLGKYVEADETRKRKLSDFLAEMGW